MTGSRIQNLPNLITFSFMIFPLGTISRSNEGAHYAFVCKKHGKTLVNVFVLPQEGQQLTTSLIDLSIGLWREYSRVLSEKVWYGAVKVSKDGYSAAAPLLWYGAIIIR